MALSLCCSGPERTCKYFQLFSVQFKEKDEEYTPWDGARVSVVEVCSDGAFNSGLGNAGFGAVELAVVALRGVSAQLQWLGSCARFSWCVQALGPCRRTHGGDGSFVGVRRIVAG